MFVVCGSNRAEDYTIRIDRNMSTEGMTFTPDNKLLCRETIDTFNLYSIKEKAFVKEKQVFGPKDSRGSCYPTAVGFSDTTCYFFTWNTINAYDMTDWHALPHKSVPIDSPAYHVFKLVTPELTFFAYENKKSRLEEWSLVTGKMVGSATFATANVRDVVFCGDGSRVVDWADKQNAVVYETRTGKKVGKFAIPDGMSYSSVSLSQDGKKVYVPVRLKDSRGGTKGCALNTLSSKDGSEVGSYRLDESIQSVYTIVPSPDGTHHAIRCYSYEYEKRGGGGKSTSLLVIIDTKAKKTVRSIPLTANSVSSVDTLVFSANNKFLASSNYEGIVNIYALDGKR